MNENKQECSEVIKQLILLKEIKEDNKEISKSQNDSNNNFEEKKKRQMEIDKIASNLEIQDEINENEASNLSLSDHYKIFSIKETSFTKFNISHSNSQNESKFFYDIHNNCFVIKAPSKIEKIPLYRSKEVILKDRSELKISRKVDPFILLVRRK